MVCAIIFYIRDNNNKMEFFGVFSVNVGVENIKHRRISVR